MNSLEFHKYKTPRTLIAIKPNAVANMFHAMPATNQHQSDSINIIMNEAHNNPTRQNINSIKGKARLRLAI